MIFRDEISIWFFVGVSLLVNGALILGAGIYYWIRPAVERTVLYQLHANVWWGALLMIFGLIYCIKFWPKTVSSANTR
jgi:hypothetical protein